MSEDDSVEIISEVLESTRRQLSRTINIVSELEGLLSHERKKNEKLRAALSKYESEVAPKTGKDAS